MYEYLSLLPKPLDSQQIKACCVDKNTIVAAGAGSGKTQVLATRFAWLVMSKEISVEKILTLTFTKKAAAEMYERIYQMLVFFAQNPKTPEEERKRAQKAIDNFSNTHIQTLDSYCGGVVRQAANRYGIKPNFSTGSSDAGRTIKNLALPFLLQFRNDPAIQKYTKPGKLQKTAEELFAKTILEYTSLADSNTFFEDALVEQKKLIVSEWNKVFNSTTDNFSSIIEKIADEYANYPNDKKSSPYFLALCKVLPFNSGCSNIFDVLPKEIILTEDNISDKNIQNEVSDFINHYSKISFKQNLKGFTPDLRKQVKELIEIVTNKISPLACYVTDYETAKRIYQLLDQFLAQVNDSKRRTGQLSFRDVTELALKILLEQEDIRTLEQNLYDRIMIDEFQDNNKKNRDLLFILANNKEKLFFVGDEKQSIYKFRGADVSVFKELQKDLNVTPLQMIYNYRSSKKLLNIFNKIFGGYTEENNNWVKAKNVNNDDDINPVAWIFPEKPNNAFEAAFTKENIAKKNDLIPADPNDETDEIPVHFCMYNSNVEKQLKNRSTNGNPVETHQEAFLSPKDQEAYFIAKKILEIKETKLIDGKKINFSDIAILDRTRTNRSILTRYLSRSGIPYTVDQNSNLFEEAPINDIYNFLRICIYPGDMLSYAAFLSSPFVCLSEASVETILSCIQSKCSEEIEKNLKPEEYTKFLASQDLQKEFTQFATCHAITDTISKLWYEYGYRFETQWNKTVSLYEEQYDFLFELARQTDDSGKSLDWFVDELDTTKSEGFSFFGNSSDLDSKNVDYPMEKTDSVKIMTIHKSKGLQFPIVFLYGTTSGLKADSNRDSVYFDEKYGVSLNISGGKNNFFFTLQAEEESEKEKAEFKRVLYVGFTRAKKEVYVTGVWSYPKKTDTSASMLEEIILNSYPGIKTDPDYARGSTVYEANPNALFDFYSINPTDKMDLIKTTSAGRENSIKSKQDFIKEIDEKYQNAKILTKETLSPRYISPSSLEENYELINEKSEDSIAPENILFPEMSKTIVSIQDFDFNDFGTLAHSYLEAFANGIMPENFTPAASLISKLQTSKNKGKCNEILQYCVEMTKNFSSSDTAKLIENASLKKAEYKFLHNQNGQIIRGIIDLLLQNPDGSLTIIDYKTDEIIQPKRYIEQQKCYAAAASAMFDVPCNKITSLLFYLRYAQEIDITKYCLQ